MIRNISSFFRLGQRFFPGLTVLVSITCLVACGGGGGGGGDTPNSSTRTNGTGVRIIHAGLDVEPVDLKIGETYVNHTSFLEPNFFAQTSPGLLGLTLERANSPGVTIFTTPVTLGASTEYTLLISGQVQRRTFAVTILEEPVARPERGQARVQLLNALEGSSPIQMNIAGQTVGPINFRLASSGILVPSGPQTIVITNTRGAVIGNFVQALADQGEVTFVVGGSTSQGVVIIRAYEDLD